MAPRALFVFPKTAQSLLNMGNFRYVYRLYLFRFLTPQPLPAGKCTHTLVTYVVLMCLDQQFCYHQVLMLLIQAISANNINFIVASDYMIKLTQTITSGLEGFCNFCFFVICSHSGATDSTYPLFIPLSHWDGIQAYFSQVSSANWEWTISVKKYVYRVKKRFHFSAV